MNTDKPVHEVSDLLAVSSRGPEEPHVNQVFADLPRSLVERAGATLDLVEDPLQAKEIALEPHACRVEFHPMVDAAQECRSRRDRAAGGVVSLACASWPQVHDLGPGPHRRSDLRTDRLVRLLHGIVGEVRVSRRCRGLDVPEQFADDKQALARARGNAGERMPQVVQPQRAGREIAV